MAIKAWQKMESWFNILRGEVVLNMPHISLIPMVYNNQKPANLSH